MKTAYELALERMESQGIERPQAKGLDEALRQRMAEARREAEAKLAELEILHRDEIDRLVDPEAREEAMRTYTRERRRIEERRDRKLDELRGG